jgi:hypothetical protein
VIDDTTIKLNAPWSVIPTGPKAQFEIDLFSSVSLPNVRVKIFTQQTPAVVVDETNGSTAVSEMPLSDATAQLNASDQILVRLSAAPASDVHVTLLNANSQIKFYDAAGATLLPSDGFGLQYLTVSHTSGGTNGWDVFQTVIVKAIVDGVVENFHKADLKLAVAGDATYRPYVTTVDVGDANYHGRRVADSVQRCHRGRRHGLPGNRHLHPDAHAGSYRSAQPGEGHDHRAADAHDAHRRDRLVLAAAPGLLGARLRTLHRASDRL